MTKSEGRGGIRTDLRELVDGLPAIEFERKELSPRLQEMPFETQMLSLGDVSVDRETEELKQILVALERI
jgi:hypothetical protein